jgi:outer membrane protein assembly factor BamB
MTSTCNNVLADVLSRARRVVRKSILILSVLLLMVVGPLALGAGANTIVDIVNQLLLAPLLSHVGHSACASGRVCRDAARFAAASTSAARAGASELAEPLGSAVPSSLLSVATARHREPASALPVPTLNSDWLLWGGKNRDFISSATGLADSWPASGPKKLWSRTLGDGYSAIAEETGTLYTAFRRDSKDVVTALRADNGKTIWEYAYENPFKNSYSEGVGPGPYAMPQVVGSRVISASGTGKIHSFDKKTGKVMWSHDLYSEFGGTHLDFGYSCHALPYEDSLICLAGGNGSAVVAFRQSDGAVLWRALSFNNSHSSPLLINVDGQTQVVALTADEVIGFNPDNGAELWRHPHKTHHGLACSTPVWAPGNLLFVASAYNTGARVLQLNQSGGHTTVKELWYNQHLQSHFGTAIQHDGYVYFSSGYSGPAFITAVELKTGITKWQERGFAKAQLVSADGKLILTDEDGALAICRATPEKFEVLSRTSVLQRIAWTPPTLAARHLYLRDRGTISAYDLG